MAGSAHGLTEIAGTIGKASGTVSDTAAGIADIKRSADQLAKLSEGLKGMLAQFRV